MVRKQNLETEDQNLSGYSATYELGTLQKQNFRTFSETGFGGNNFLVLVLLFQLCEVFPYSSF